MGPRAVFRIKKGSSLDETIWGTGEERTRRVSFARQNRLAYYLGPVALLAGMGAVFTWDSPPAGILLALLAVAALLVTLVAMGARHIAHRSDP